jgi:DNA-binding protein HU-beta
MSKKAIAIKMAKDAGISHAQAEKAFQAMMAGIKSSLKNGQRVAFSGFGSFEVRTRKPRKGRNPKTGEIISIPERKRVKFIPSKSLKSIF